MSFQIVCKRVAAALFAALVVFTITASAQMPVVNAPAARSLRVAERNNLYCAGFVQKSPIDTRAKIVGAVEEQEKVMFSQNDVMYVSLGAGNGVQVGDTLTVVRPKGQVSTEWTHKDGGLGFYVQEVGALEVVRVKEHVSVVKVKVSCDNFLLGDLVQPSEARMSPVYKYRQPMDLYADANGKATGRLFMSRDNTDLIYKDNIVYIDLGAEDNVKPGDYLTVYRRLGDGNPYFGDWGESVSARDDGFSSFEYRGGKFSNQAARKSGDKADGRVVTTSRAKDDRPDDLRKVVGEMVILNVKERTATALITRNAQEIHTGDWVEVQ